MLAHRSLYSENDDTTVRKKNKISSLLILTIVQHEVDARHLRVCVTSSLFIYGRVCVKLYELVTVNLDALLNRVEFQKLASFKQV